MELFIFAAEQPNMILDGFKSKNVIKQFNKSLNNSLKSAVNSSSKIEKVLLFVENEIDRDFLNVLSQNLKIDISDICLFIFKKKIKKNEVCENCISIKDFGLFGKLTNETIKGTLEKSFDLIISLTKGNEFISSIVANSNASFRVGLLDKYSQINDLTINLDTVNLVTFNEELKKYLEILKKL
jgi:hypothetical protein